MIGVARWSQVFGAASAVLLIACADDDPTAPRVSANQVIASVTPDVAAQLDANGRFVFAAPEGGDVPWISSDRARDIAVAYWRGFGPSIREALSDERGAGVAENLQPCRRVFLAETGYEPFPLNLPRELRRNFGAAWLVSLCNGNEQQVGVAVSVESVDLTIDNSGLVHGMRSGDISSVAVPVGTTFPLEPELGAVGIAELVGVRVSAVPHLRRKARGTDAHSGMWTYSLESTVQLRGNVSERDIDTNAVGFARWDSMYNLRPVTANPDSASVERSEYSNFFLPGGVPTVYELIRRLDVPVRVEPFQRRRDP